LEKKICILLKFDQLSSSIKEIISKQDNLEEKLLEINKEI
jgi:outer membrane murein-binding lipoprotein Lpp